MDRVLRSLAFRFFTQRHGLVLRPDVLEFLIARLPTETAQSKQPADQLSQLVEFIASQYAQSSLAKSQTFVDRQTLEAVMDKIFRATLALRANEETVPLDARQFVRILDCKCFGRPSVRSERDFWRAQLSKLRERLHSEAISIVSVSEEHVGRRVSVFGLVQRDLCGQLVVEDLDASISLRLDEETKVDPKIGYSCFALATGTVVQTEAQKLAVRVASLDSPPLKILSRTNHQSIQCVYQETVDQLVQIERRLRDSFFLFINDQFTGPLASRLLGALGAHDLTPAAVFLVGKSALGLEAQISSFYAGVERPLVYAVVHDECMQALPGSPGPSSQRLMNPARIAFCTQQIVICDYPNCAVDMARNALAPECSGPERDFAECKSNVFEAFLEQDFAADPSGLFYRHPTALSYMSNLDGCAVLFINQRASPVFCRPIGPDFVCIAQNVASRPCAYLYYPADRRVRELVF